MLKRIDNNVIFAKDVHIEAGDFIPAIAILKAVRPDHVYIDGKKTDEIKGYKYDLVDPTTYTTFIVKVPDKDAIITNEEIIERGFLAVDIPVEKTKMLLYELGFGKGKVSITSPSLALRD